MASDDAYASFLDKVNQPTRPATTSSSTKIASTNALHKEVAVPKSLTHGLEGLYYVSEVDEEFEEVGLKWNPGNELDDESFASLISTSTSSVTAISAENFDPQGHYTRALDNVEKSTAGGVQIFRVEGEGARVEYWIVGVSEDGKVVLGLRAKSVES